MFNVMVSYFKRNYKVQRNKRQSRSERADPSRSEQADQIMSKEVIVEHIRDGASRSQQTDSRGMIRLQQSGLKASGEKPGMQERSENITEREKSRSKGENKSVVRISERRARKVVWIRAEQAMQYRMTQSKEKIRQEKVDKQRRKSTRNDGR